MNAFPTAQNRLIPTFVIVCKAFYLFISVSDNYFKKMEPKEVSPLPESPSPVSSVSSLDIAEVVNYNKRKRVEEDEEGNITKRRSEEPLFPLFKKLVDETAVEESIDEDKDEKSSVSVSVSEEDSTETSETEDEEQWEVEEIVDYQYCRQSEAGLYLVKWIGWAPEHNTWEPGKTGQV